jgi:hypothetical protein
LGETKKEEEEETYSSSFFLRPSQTASLFHLTLGGGSDSYGVNLSHNF